MPPDSSGTRDGCRRPLRAGRGKGYPRARVHRPPDQRHRSLHGRRFDRAADTKRCATSAQLSVVMPMGAVIDVDLGVPAKPCAPLMNGVRVHARMLDIHSMGAPRLPVHGERSRGRASQPEVAGSSPVAGPPRSCGRADGLAARSLQALTCCSEAVRFILGL